MDKSQGHLESFIYVYSFVFCSFALAIFIINIIIYFAQET